ncbi:MAG TPA: LUD domain-containing protein [Acidimicrobiales bacterium]
MSKVFDTDLPFPTLAKTALADAQLRANLAHATTTIRNKRLQVVSELDDWEELRSAGAAIKDYSLDHLDELCVELEKNVVAHGGVVHWARDAGEANAIVVSLVQATGADSVVKVKSMATAEIELNVALEEHGITAYETDLAELIVQLGDDLPSHILVPAIHKNRSQIRQIFLDEMGKSGLAAPTDLTNDPAELAAAARAHLRQRFLSAKVAISGANFVIADTGALVIVESEGNGRMCLTLPETLISVVGIEKILPNWQSLEVFMQLLPRSSTGERMNPYTSIFTGATPGNGPSNFHLVLIDNGRSSALAEEDGRDVLRCIRCSACLNVCPVYERTGGHSYGNPYPGPIGAVLVPQLRRGERTPLEDSLPYASTLCGACYVACPVKIDIPKILVRLRSEVVDEKRREHPRDPELLSMSFLEKGFSSPRLFRRAIALGALVGRLPLTNLRFLPPPLNKWSGARNTPLPPATSFRSWFAQTHPDANVSSRSASTTRDPLVHQHGAAHDAKPGHVGTDIPGRAGILSSIDTALGTRRRHSTLARDRAYRLTGSASVEERRNLLADRLRDYRANVVECDEVTLSTTINDLLLARASHSVAAPADTPPDWLEAIDASVHLDDPTLSVSELDAIDASVTGCSVAIAQTGTIILDSGVHQGRRILSLIPDHLIVVIRDEQIVEVVAEGVARLRADSTQTWISGPSATSDIELERIEGVHGPRSLDVILVTTTVDVAGVLT